MSSSFLSRIRILSALLCLFALFLVAKLFFVQIIHGREFDERANRQYVTPMENVFERGTIFFKSKDGELISAAGTVALI